jgi:predicted TIM-barrel fold metal-dependent hydrolase
VRTSCRLAWFSLLVTSIVACRSPSPPPQATAPAPPPLPPPTPAPPPPPPKPAFKRADIPRIDVHTHVSLGASTRAARLLESYGIVYSVNLSGPPPGAGLDDYIADTEVAYRRSVVFVNLPWALCKKPGCGKRLAAELVKAKALGVRGLKITKGLGLAFEGPDGKLLRVDDPSLDPIFEKAGELHLPVAIHVGDPQAFWQEPGPANERNEELSAHPEWSFYAEYKAGRVLGWRELYESFLRRVARHPKTTFIGVHFGNAPEEPDLVAQALDKYPNLVIDTAARVPAIGRTDANHSASRMREFFLKYQDRILFGTDTGVGNGPAALMFGSTGLAPPTKADADLFYQSTWRYFETADTDIPSPTPIQGRWTISGIQLPREVLEKLYYKNAQRIIGLSLPAELMPRQESGVAPTLKDL